MDIKDMADLLLKGGKMLNRSCPECNAPLFQFQGRTFCPRCGWEEGASTPGREVPAKEPKQVQPKASIPKLPTPGAVDASSALADARRAVLGKIGEYAKRLEGEGETVSVMLNVEALSDLLALLERIIEAEVRTAGTSAQVEAG